MNKIFIPAGTFQLQIKIFSKENYSGHSSKYDGQWQQLKKPIYV